MLYLQKKTCLTLAFHINPNSLFFTLGKDIEAADNQIIWNAVFLIFCKKLGTEHKKMYQQTSAYRKLWNIKQTLCITNGLRTPVLTVHLDWSITLKYSVVQNISSKTISAIRTNPNWDSRPWICFAILIRKFWMFLLPHQHTKQWWCHQHKQQKAEMYSVHHSNVILLITTK